jgi:hypothetical protein
MAADRRVRAVNCVEPKAKQAAMYLHGEGEIDGLGETFVLVLVARPVV